MPDQWAALLRPLLWMHSGDVQCLRGMTCRWNHAAVGLAAVSGQFIRRVGSKHTRSAKDLSHTALGGAHRKVVRSSNGL
jgi:hypothetical protein